MVSLERHDTAVYRLRAILWHPYGRWVVRLLILCAAVSVLLQLGLPQTRTIQNDDFQGPRGHMYVVELRTPLPLLEVRGDTNQHPARSTARVSEDWSLLGPSHSMHAKIIEEGGGLYSHYESAFYFSSSDNTDPRTNGRVYRIEYTLYSPLWLTVALVSLCIVAVAAASDPNDRRASLVRFAELLLFGLKPRIVFAAAVAIGLLVFLVILLALPETTASLFEWLGHRILGLAVLGYSIAAGVLLSMIDFKGVRQNAMRLLQCVGLVVLAYGPSNEVFGPIQYLGMIAGLLAGLPLRLGLKGPVAGLARVLDWWNRLEKNDGLTLTRWIVLASMLACLINVMPEIILYWDNSGWKDSSFYGQVAHMISSGRAPQGVSNYMPLYQYGLAAFYWAFGHVYFVQQVVNVVLAVVTAGLMATCAWLLFRRTHVVLVVGIAAACWYPFHHTPVSTQIEGWYIPIFTVSVLALLIYLKRPSWRTIALLALTAALVFNTRLQGAFYACALGLSVFFVIGPYWRTRLTHGAVFAALFFIIGIVPWSMRNYVIEGRFSPSTQQSASFLAIYNDRRVPLYGIRYWEAQEVQKDWAQRYPDPDERLEAQRQEFRRRLVEDTGYFIAAAPWRAMAFYGLLPPGAKETTYRPPNWETELLGYLDYNSVFLSLLLFSAIGVAARPTSRYHLLFAGLILANLLVGLMVGSAEARLCYPVLFLHLLMGSAVFAPFAVGDRSRKASEPDDLALPMDWGRAFAAAAVILVPVMIASHFLVGQKHQYRPISSSAWRFATAVEIDPSAPRLHPEDLKREGGLTPIELNKSYRVRLKLTNRMLPPNWVCCWSEHDKLLNRDRSVQYYYSRVIGPGDSYTSERVAVRYEGTVVTGELIEESIVDATIRFETEQDEVWFLPRYWAVVEKAVVERPANAR